MGTRPPARQARWETEDEDDANAAIDGEEAHMTDHTVAHPAPDAARAPARRALPQKPQARDLALPVGFRLHEYRIDAILLLDGLAAVHAAGYLHRDIKPDNIYVRDEDGSLVLLDFGSARQTESEKQDAGTVVTPGYGAIEQYAGGGRQGPWTDIYSLGATLFWLLTGKKPVDAPSRLADPDPQPRAEDLCRGRYSPEFLRAVDWALRMHPSNRPQDVAQFRSALFAKHAAVLGLREALSTGDDDAAPAAKAWSRSLASPQLFRRRAVALGYEKEKKK